MIRWRIEKPQKTQGFRGAECEYIGSTEGNHYDIGTSYLEIDWEKDLVVRQMDVFTKGCSWGKWTGTALGGHICDQNASILDLAGVEEISATDIAYAAELHPKYAMNVFKKSTGMTLNSYLNLLRLSYAQAMLMKDDISVVDVAMTAGFGSLSAFNKSFQKLAGKSPSSFRRDSHARPAMMAVLERDFGRA